MTNYSDIVRKIKQTYPDLKFKIQKSDSIINAIDIIFIDFDKSLEITYDLTWDNVKNTIKRIIENSNICNICFENNSNDWCNTCCSICGIDYCGLCFIKNIKINKKIPVCPFCGKNDFDIDYRIEYFYCGAYDELYKHDFDLDTIMKDFYSV